jgi:hypothetical protein
LPGQVIWGTLGAVPRKSRESAGNLPKKRLQSAKNCLYTYGKPSRKCRNTYRKPRQNFVNDNVREARTTNFGYENGFLALLFYGEQDFKSTGFENFSSGQYEYSKDPGNNAL